MSYRIKQEGDRYYPQYRSWFFWWKFEEIVGLDGAFIYVKFDNLQEARDFISKEIEYNKKKKSKNKVVIHSHLPNSIDYIMKD